jgi:hypothetical protein
MTNPAALPEEVPMSLQEMEDRANGDRLKTLPFKDGDNIYRVLFPFGEFARSKGLPVNEISLHWWRNSAKDNGFPVRCAKAKKTDTSGCPMCESYYAQSSELKKALAPYTKSVDGGDDKVDWDSVPAALKAKSELVQAIKVQHQYYYNAVGLNDDVGVLKVSPTMGDLINAELIKCQKERKFNPVSSKEGVFFTMTRTKKGVMKYEFKIEIRRKSVTVDGEVLEKIDKGPLSEAATAKLASNMKDLFNLFPAKTADDLKKIMEKKGKSGGADLAPPTSATAEAAGFNDDPSGDEAAPKDPSPEDLALLAKEME